MVVYELVNDMFLQQGSSLCLYRFCIFVWKVVNIDNMHTIVVAHYFLEMQKNHHIFHFVSAFLRIVSVEIDRLKSGLSSYTRIGY